jgi:phenylacetate-CoA ligase
MRRMEKITGRADDMMIVRGVNVFPTQIEEQILKVRGLAPHFQIELWRDGRLDGLTVHVEASPAAAAPDARRTAAATLTQRIKETIGISVKVDVAEPGGVARSQGKAQRIVDNRPKS